jgi:O-antigen ligase
VDADAWAEYCWLSITIVPSSIRLPTTPVRQATPMVAYTSFAVFIFCALSLVISSGFSYGAALLFLGAAVLLWKRPTLGLARDDRLLCWTFAGYFLLHAIENGLHHAALREYDAPARFLLAVPVILVLCAWPARAAALWGGVAVGAIGAGIFACFHQTAVRQLTLGGVTNPIQFGNISIVLGMLALAGIGWALHQRQRFLWVALMLLGAAGGIAGAILSSSRGSWLALPVGVCIVAIHYAFTHGRRMAFAGLGAILVLLGSLYAQPDSDFRQRSDLAEHEVQAYLSNRTPDSSGTSVGQRLEMWRAGVTMIPGHLLLGVGKHGYMDAKQALIAAGQANPAIAQHTHLHNDYLDALVKRGVPGLLATLAVLLLPLWLFARHLHGAPAARPYALAGVLLCTSYLVFGLTQAFFTHNNGVIMFTFWTAILWTLLRQHLPPSTRAP